MRAKSALLAATCLTVSYAMAPGVAQAQQVSGFYIGAGAGVNLLQTETITNFGNLLGVTYSGRPKIKFDVGYVGLGSFGYGLGNGFRVEAEGNFRNNSIRGIGTLSAQHGGSEKYGAMFNALYDIDLTDYYGITAFTPYVGIGAGYAYERIDGLRASTNLVTFTSNRGSSQFAYQAIVGVGFPLTSITPGLSVTAEYRFFGTPHNAQYPTALTSDGVKFTGKLKVADDLNHSILVGLRYAFNTEEPPPPPPPAPVVAPAPQPSRTYLVFFDWDRADLTARAKQIIADAAANAGRVSATRIEVSGHADRTGTPQYNQALSLRRAQNVASELVHDGVQQNMIDIHAYGDTRPLVPTAAGVREPQNRRVEIVIK